MFDKILPHLKRLSYHLGGRISLGGQSFMVKGYHPSHLQTSVGYHEFYLLKVIEAVLAKKSGAFIDVGVNVGQTLIKVLSVNPNRAYYGFEPQVACCFNIDNFLRLNALSNATVLPIALSNSNGIATFFSRNSHDEMASLLENSDHTGNSPSVSHVQTRIGDEVMDELAINEIAIIKIDVEGAELQVLKGLRETLEKKRPSVIFEVLPNFYGVERRQTLPEAECNLNTKKSADIFKFFLDADYDVFAIDDNGNEHGISRFPLENNHEYLGNNYVAHGERH